MLPAIFICAFFAFVCQRMSVLSIFVLVVCCTYIVPEIRGFNSILTDVLVGQIHILFMKTPLEL